MLFALIQSLHKAPHGDRNNKVWEGLAQTAQSARAPSMSICLCGDTSSVPLVWTIRSLTLSPWFDHGFMLAGLCRDSFNGYGVEAATYIHEIFVRITIKLLLQTFY